MSDSFRQLTEADTAAYYALVHAAYASARDLGIKFDAATADAAQMQRHIAAHGVYGMFRDSEFMRKVDEECLRIREAEREAARRGESAE